MIFVVSKEDDPLRGSNRELLITFYPTLDYSSNDGLIKLPDSPMFSTRQQVSDKYNRFLNQSRVSS